MALKIEGVVDRSMHAEEALVRSSRFEPLHLAFSSPYRLMRILGAIVLRSKLPQTGETGERSTRLSAQKHLPPQQNQSPGKSLWRCG
jgi:hypothetical protein